jgi:diaminopimelate decarboxylase
MDHYAYRDGRLFCEDVDLCELARRAGTPTYVYSRATLTHHYSRLSEAFAPLHPTICYSVKSCPNLGVLRVLAGLGSGMDVVSGGELRRALLAGASADKIVYAGVGKTEAEIIEALAAGVGTFNIESEPEFQVIAALAAERGATARAALRVNPDVDADTHKYTTTGTAETKFGVDLSRAPDFFRRYAGHKHLKLTGLHLHIGSPVASPDPYVRAIQKTLAVIEQLRTDGHTIDTLDLGGGFSADYRTGQSLAASDYAARIVPLLAPLAASGVRIILEPGRFISANSGVLLTQVQYVKQSAAKKFLVCDAGMHTLIRPALYGSFHFVWPASCAPQHVPPRRDEKLDLPCLEPCDVVGPICESSDFLAQDRPLPPMARGDILAVFGAGAYGMSMASRYNSHPLPAEVLIDGAHASVVRRRETYDDLVAHELTPAELAIGSTIEQ